MIAIFGQQGSDFADREPEVFERAKALGQAIANTDILEEVRAAERRIQLDPQAQDLFQEMQDLQQKVQQAQMSGEPLSPQVQNQMQQVKMQMQGNDTCKKWLDAQEEFSNMMQEINQTIGEAMAQQDAQNS